MNKFLILTSIAGITLVSSIAGAVTLDNKDKTTSTVSVEIDGKKSDVKVVPGTLYDSKDKDVVLTLGKNEPVSAKGKEKLIIKDDKILPETTTASPAEASSTSAVGLVKIAPKGDIVVGKPTESKDSK